MSRANILAMCGAIAALVVAAGALTFFMARHAAAPEVRSAAGESAPPQFSVAVTGSRCDPEELTVPAGRVTFAIHNDGARALEWEILKGVMVIDERENIAPGFTQKLTTRLEPGDYDLTCGIIGSPKGKLHVAASGAGRAKPSAVDLIGPLAEYRVYASYEIDDLAEEARRIADAVKAGDLAAAQAPLVAARTHYARIASIAPMFGELDAAIDSQSADARAADFPRLQAAVFESGAPGDAAAAAGRLVSDVEALQTKFETLEMSPEPTIAGAAQALRAASGAGSDLSRPVDVASILARIEGARKIVELFRPLIERVDSGLAHRLDDDFAAVEATFAKYRGADGGLPADARLSEGDRATLQGATRKLADEMSAIPGALGLS